MPRTLLRPIADPSHMRAAIAEAAAVIRRGGLVAFPTETVYGLGANALDAAASTAIFEAKQRALNDPLIVHVDTVKAACDALIDMPALTAQQRAMFASLAQAFWPGPLTMVLPKRAAVPSVVSAGLDSVAVRMPDHPVARALIAASGVPIAAPSANRFGHVSPTSAQHVLADLDGRIDMVLDNGVTRIGVESTVLSLLHDPPVILRPGGVTREMLAAQGVVVGTAPAQRPDDAQPAPGMLASHYAPRAALEILPDTAALVARHTALTRAGERAGVLITAEERATCAALHPQFDLGAGLEDMARSLYAGLRALDDSGVTTILISAVRGGGLGEALRDRLSRAASA